MWTNNTRQRPGGAASHYILMVKGNADLGCTCWLVICYSWIAIGSTRQTAVREITKKRLVHCCMHRLWYSSILQYWHPQGSRLNYGTVGWPACRARLRPPQKLRVRGRTSSLESLPLTPGWLFSLWRQAKKANNVRALCSRVLPWTIWNALFVRAYLRATREINAYASCFVSLLPCGTFPPFITVVWYCTW